MFSYCWSLNAKQLGHALLCCPDSFIYSIYLNVYFSVFIPKDYYFAYVFHQIFHLYIKKSSHLQFQASLCHCYAAFLYILCSNFVR